MQLDIQRRLAPLAEKFVKELTSLVEKQIDEVISRASASFETALASAIDKAQAGAIATPAAPTPRKTTPRATIIQGKRVAKPAARDRTAPQINGKRPPTCTKCGAVGGNARGCGKASGHETQTKSATKAKSSDDSEDEPGAPDVDPASDAAAEHALAEVVKAQRITRRPRDLTPEEPRVIPRAVLVAMLHADRLNNAVGDAGGFIARADRAPSLVGHTDEKREVCPVHGWVGRFAFDRDQHNLCIDHESPRCAHCEGRKVVMGDFCSHCEGTGVEPIEPPVVATPREVRVPIVAAPGAIVRQVSHGHAVRNAPRSDTLAPKQITREMLRLGALEVEAAGPPVDEPRPRTRGECRDAPRPCPWAACRHHLYLDINPETGSIKFNFPDVEPEDLLESCSLDIADAGPHVLDDVGNLLNLTRERTRQVETIAKLNLRVGLRRAV